LYIIYKEFNIWQFHKNINKIDELFVTKEILNEIEDVLRRPKFYADKYGIYDYLKSIEEIANIVIPHKQIFNGSRDKSDNKYVECGIAVNADYIISGDIHLLELNEYDKIKIVTAKHYLEIVN